MPVRIVTSGKPWSSTQTSIEKNSEPANKLLSGRSGLEVEGSSAEARRKLQVHFTSPWLLILTCASSLQIRRFIEPVDSKKKFLRTAVCVVVPMSTRRKKILRFDGFHKPSNIRRIFPSIQRFEFCSAPYMLPQLSLSELYSYKVRIIFFSEVTYMYMLHLWSFCTYHFHFF